MTAAARYLELPIGTLRAAVRYYAAFPAEADDALARREAVAEREHAAAELERTIFR